jgi:Ni/Co efflux regulator RcnB
MMMRKILLAALAATVLTPAIASAQDARDLRHDQREMRHDRNDLRHDERRGDWRDARNDRHDLRQDRRDTREDWRGYRDSHRDTFRMRPYQGPRGYAYRAVTPGFVFAPGYYHQRYWIANPGQYRLPVARPGLRWVRYGNDVVLVNVRTGRVIQVYNGFFW